MDLVFFLIRGGILSVTGSCGNFRSSSKTAMAASFLAIFLLLPSPSPLNSPTDTFTTKVFIWGGPASFSTWSEGLLHYCVRQKPYRCGFNCVRMQMRYRVVNVTFFGNVKPRVYGKHLQPNSNLRYTSKFTGMFRFSAISNTWLISDLLRFSSSGSFFIYT